jgi:hypothetical protein
MESDQKGRDEAYSFRFFIIRFLIIGVLGNEDVMARGVMEKK